MNTEQLLQEHPAKSLLETTLNTRDLGGYSCDHGNFRTLKNRIYRSDVQNYPSLGDKAFLLSYRITTIIDLRGLKDVERKPSGFANVKGFLYINCPIDEGSGVPESIEAVPLSYLHIAEAASMPNVFHAIACARDGVMFNCTAGKDRTGVVSALLLWLCGVPKEEIIFDYMLTKECNKERFRLIHENFPEIDMNIVIPREENIVQFFELVEEKYGTVEEYFEKQCGAFS